MIASIRKSMRTITKGQCSDELARVSEKSKESKFFEVQRFWRPHSSGAPPFSKSSVGPWPPGPTWPARHWSGHLCLLINRFTLYAKKNTVGISRIKWSWQFCYLDGRASYRDGSSVNISAGPRGKWMENRDG